MAINIRRLCNFNISLASNIFAKSNFIKPGVRFLYTEHDLGITSYENSRFVIHNQFVTIEDTFRNKMNEVCERDGIIYTEDLKAMLHLAENNESDLQLVNTMLEKYVVNKSGDKLGTFIFGPVIMRLYYYLNIPQAALATFNNPVLNSELQYHSVFRVLMCLLYKHHMYKEMRDVYQKFVAEKGVEFIGRSTVLFYAACLRENTPESFEIAFNSWREECTVARPTLRSCSMVALLALKNNNSKAALEIVSVVDSQFAISVRCIKLLVYLDMERYLQIVPLLQYAVEQANNSMHRLKFFADVIYAIEEKVKNGEGRELDAITVLLNDIKRLDLLDTTCTLQEYLLRTISIPIEVRPKEVDTQKFTRTSRFPRPRFSTRRNGQMVQGLKNYI